MKYTIALICFMLVWSCQWMPGKPEKIGVLPLGDVPAEYVTLAGEELRSFYKTDIVYLPAQSLPSSAYYEPRKRYRADKLIKWLSGFTNDTIQKVVGITEKDISIYDGEKDWGIFGLGYNPGPSCVISLFRLKKDPAKIKERFTKVVLHEAGHNIGLPHCSSGEKFCLMRDAEGLMKTVDEERKEFCMQCKQKLQLIKKAL